MKRPTHLIIHHSLTKDGQTVSWGAIRRYHTQDLGWMDIGYHFGIEQILDRVEILMGRMPTEDGAHTKEQGMNHTSLGICCVGNFDLVKPPKAQWKQCIRLCKSLVEIFNIPVANVRGHREFATYKSCPGNLWDMDIFRAELFPGRVETSYSCFGNRNIVPSKEGSDE